MFVRSSSYRRVVGYLAECEQKLVDLQERYSLLENYYKHICDLHRGQIEDLKKLVFIPKQEVPESLVVADKTITQNDDNVPLSEAEEILRERDRMLSGTWDEAVQ